MRLSAVGDVCHTLPVVRTLQTAWPETAITWIIGRLEATLLGDIPGIEFITFDKAQGFGAHRNLRRELGRRRFDLLLDMQVSLRASIASLGVRAPRRLGFDKPRARDQQWLFTNERIAERKREHVMDALFGFTDALGIHERHPRWDIPLSEADAAFAERHIPDQRPTLIVSPLANPRLRNWRNWLLERYAAVIDYAAESLGLKVILTGGPSAAEREAGEAIAAYCRAEPVDLIGQTSLKQLFALIARSRVVLSPDSGPAHMATAAGVPVIGLYATSNPGRTGPYFSRQWVVNRYPEALRRFKNTTPEQVRWGSRVRHPEAMALIEVADVTTMLDRVLDETSPRQTPLTRGRNVSTDQ
jgi:heptosyltransferase I